MQFGPEARGRRRAHGITLHHAGRRLLVEWDTPSWLRSAYSVASSLTALDRTGGDRCLMPSLAVPPAAVRSRRVQVKRGRQHRSSPPWHPSLHHSPQTLSCHPSTSWTRSHHLWCPAAMPAPRRPPLPRHGRRHPRASTQATREPHSL